VLSSSLLGRIVVFNRFYSIANTLEISAGRGI
jgi:hypothetical protein